MFRNFNGIRTHGLCVCDVVLYQLSQTTNFLQLLELRLPLRRSYLHFKRLLLKNALKMAPYSYISFFLQVNPDIK